MSPRGTLVTLLALAASAVGAAPAAGQGTTTGPAGAPGAPAVTAAQAGDGVLLSGEDRVELASSLAEATEASGICFGYELTLGGSGAASRSEVLSNAGPDVPVGESSAACPKGAATLRISLVYTSSSSEAEDSASWFATTTIPGLPGGTLTSRVKGLSAVDDGDLLGNDDDLALRNLAAALPLAVGAAAPAEQAASAQAPNGDGLTGSPGSDWLRENGAGIAIAAGLLLLALVLVLFGWRGRRGTRPPKEPGAPTRPTASRPPTRPSGGEPPSSPTTTS